MPANSSRLSTPSLFLSRSSNFVATAGRRAASSRDSLPSLLTSALAKAASITALSLAAIGCSIAGVLVCAKAVSAAPASSTGRDEKTSRERVDMTDSPNQWNGAPLQSLPPRDPSILARHYPPYSLPHGAYRLLQLLACAQPRRALTASLRTSSTVSESSQPMQASVMLLP